MRTIKPSGRFTKDYRRVCKSHPSPTFERDFAALVDKLARDEILEPRFRDHQLTGNWRGHRDCHVRPDLVLIYRKPGRDTLLLVRLGSHSELRL